MNQRSSRISHSAENQGWKSNDNYISRLPDR